MRTVGRLTSALAVVGITTTVLLLAIRPELGRPVTSDIRAVDLVGLLIAATVPVSWVLAILHWGSNTALGGRKKAWGLLVILGSFVGAAIYFFHPGGAAAAE